MESVSDSPALARVEPRERPILFGGSMVCAILGNRKTQTRRIVKPRPPSTKRGRPWVSMEDLLNRCPTTDVGRTASRNKWVCRYRQLWEEINGAGSWELNPFVWCVAFRKLETA